jgi:hypothetical protein
MILQVGARHLADVIGPENFFGAQGARGDALGEKGYRRAATRRE